MPTPDARKLRLVELADLAIKETDPEKQKEIFDEMLRIIDDITKEPR